MSGVSLTLSLHVPARIATDASVVSPPLRKIGEDLKEKIIPRAVDFYTGRAIQFDDEVSDSSCHPSLRSTLEADRCSRDRLGG